MAWHVRHFEAWLQVGIELRRSLVAFTALFSQSRGDEDIGIAFLFVCWRCIQLGARLGRGSI